MNKYALLLNPGHNRVYYKSSQQLSAVELSIVAQALESRPLEIRSEQLCGVYYLTFTTEVPLSQKDLAKLSRLSFAFALYQVEGELLRPLELPCLDLTAVSISSQLKYIGKTNELFTRMMINVAAASYAGPEPERIALLDPIAGKGTTLFEGLDMGFDCYGIEISDKSAAEGYHYLKKYLEIQRLKHTTDLQKQSGPNKSFTAKRYGVELAKTKEDFKAHRQQHWEIVSGNSMYADRFYQKNKFHVLVGDLPYGVQHGNVSGDKQLSRSPRELIETCLPAWRNVLKPGGVLTLAWNTYVFPKEQFAELLTQGGFEVLREGPYDQFAHWVDNAIMRDVIVARKPAR